MMIVHMNEPPSNPSLLEKTLGRFRKWIRPDKGQSDSSEAPVDSKSLGQSAGIKMRISAEWTCVQGDQLQIPWTDVTQESEVCFPIELCRKGEGIVRLAHAADDDRRQPTLQLQAENGRYMLLYTDRDDKVQAFLKLNPTYNTAAPRGKDYFRGQLMPVRAIITDVDLIIRAFLDFARTGDLSEEYDFYDPMQMRSRPNQTMADCHAEIYSLRQRINNGATKGGDMILNLVGQDMCDFCRRDVVRMAEISEAESLTIANLDEVGDFRVYSWRPGMQVLEQEDEVPTNTSSRWVIRGHVWGDDEAWSRISAIADPSDADVIEAVQRCRDRYGVLKIEGVAGHRNNFPTLTLLAEEGRYMATLAEIAEDGYVHARSFDNPYPIYDAEFPYLACLQGNTYPAHAVIEDFDLVLEAFRQFNRTGTVSTELMP